MEILRRPVHELTFADVEEFCQRGIPEGTQIDYKKDLSQKGLAKHFAAFSNARGGLIIIGVEEDATCKPSKWEGVNPADKYEERIHQQAKDVDPIPRYEVFTTNTGTNGNVFVLVRIQEGDLTPYYVQNDANIYMRTGNITKLCTELASPQETARLFGKRENAQLAREAWLKRAELLYDSTIARFHKQHEKWHKINISNTVYAPIPVHKSAILTAFIQPYFPNQNLTSPQELQVILNDLRYAQERKRIYWLNSVF
jgi:predicted HTH transcriptional regulator